MSKTISIKNMLAALNFLRYIYAKILNFLHLMFTHKTLDKNRTDRMIVLGVHVSGVIDCDVNPLLMPRSIAAKYFNSIQAREAIESCIKQAKDNPLQRHIPNKIKVQVSTAVGMAIKSGEVDSIMGLKIFLDAIKKETTCVAMIGFSFKDNQVIYL